MKRSIIFFLQFLPIFMYSQSEIDSIEDKRDGRIYEIIKIDNLKWFRDNLKYETATSFCPNFEKSESDCAYGNYYSYHELTDVCPDGWRIPNEKEWNSYFEYRLKEQEGEITDVKIDTLKGEYLTINYTDTKANVNLFGDSNPLKLKEFGWVEGKRIKNKKTMTIWVKHSEVDDNRFHLHIGNENYIVHTHKHNIDDVPKKTRKFMVKCVTEGGQTNGHQ